MTHSMQRDEIRARKDLAIFVPSLRGGGAERAMLKLAAALARSGVSLDLVLANAVGAYVDAVPEHVSVVDLRAGRTLASVPRLAAYLRRTRPTVLLSSLDYANIVATWARSLSGTRPRHVLNEQNTLSQVAAQATHRRDRLVPVLARRTYPRAAAIAAVSRGVAQDLVEVIGIPGDKVRVIHNPVITPDLIARSREPLEDDWFMPQSVPVILAVGRLDPQKDYSALLEAFAALRSRRPARLMILGEGPLRGDLEAQAAELEIGDDVRLPGFVENPFAYMRSCAVYAMSSRFEGLPTVLIEALASGARIVSTDCPSGPFEILDGGRHGRLVPIGDIPALAQALTEALDDPSPRPGPDSWRPYELDTVVRQYHRLLLGADA